MFILCGGMIVRLVRVVYGYRRAFEGTADVLREVAPNSPAWDRLDKWKAHR
jgi:hypothetical protein